jgi:pimeloyl-ACP methyl ester carboxylesterase
MLLLSLACTPDFDTFGPVDGAPLVLVQGGSVERERYHWLAQEMADHDYRVLVPQYPSDLAILGGERTHRVLAEARELGEIELGPAVIMGHSLGGVVSASQWVEYPDDYAELILLASWPSGTADVGSRDERVLEVVGTEDGTPLSDFEENTQDFVDFECVVIEGMTHYDWTDDPTERELEGQVATRPQEDTRAEAVAAIVAFLAE